MIMTRKGEMLTPELIATILTKHSGNIRRTAMDLDVDRTTIYNYLNKYPELITLRDEVRENAVDEAETILEEQAIDERNTTALIFFLKTRGAKRGYGSQVQVTGADNGPIKLEVVYNDDKKDLED